MTQFKIHDSDTAPAGARPHLQQIQKILGFIPNVHGVIGNSAVSTEAMAALQGAVSKSGFSATEQQIIQIATSTVNECSYCVAGHTAFSVAQGIPDAIIAAVRSGNPLADRKLEALRRFTVAIVQQRGHVTSSETDRFLESGYSHAQVIELITVIVMKLFANLVSITTNIPLDEAFQPYAWTPPTEASNLAYIA